MSALKLESFPPGFIGDYAGSTSPDGWLFCFGQSISRITYAALFAAIGTTYGAIDGNSFSVPDCRGRITAGKDNMGGTSANRLTGFDANALGNNGGEDRHVLTTGELASHTHTMASHVHNNPAHQHYTGTPHTHSVTNSGYYSATGYVANSGAGANYNVLINPVGSPTFTSSGTGPGWSDAGYGASQSDAGNSVQNCSFNGGNAAHNNLQPTIVFNKIIKT